MRFFVGFVLVLIGLVVVQSAPVVRRSNELLNFDPDFDEFLAQIAMILPLDQYQAFEQELTELILSIGASGEIDEDAFEDQFEALLDKYLGSEIESRSGRSQNRLAQRLAKIVKANVHKKIHKRQASELLGLDVDFDGFLADMAMLLPPDQYPAFEQEFNELITSMTASGDVDETEFQVQLEALLNKYLFPDFESRSDRSQNRFAQRLTKIVKANVHKKIHKRQASELLGLDPNFDGFLKEIAMLLPLDQYQAFEQELYEMIMSVVASGEINEDAIQRQFDALLEKYLGAEPQSRSGRSQNRFTQQLVKTVKVNVHKKIHKRQAPDDLILPTPSLEEVLAAMPELAVLINPIHDALAQLATSISPAQLQSLKDQALHLVLSLASGNTDVNQFKEKLQVLFQQYFNSTGRSDVDIDDLINQIVDTDTAGLPSIIVNMLGKGTVKN